MFGGFGITELLVILAIVVMLFGTKKLRNMGGDLGSAIKGFKSAMSSEEDNKSLEDNRQSSVVADVEADAAEQKVSEQK